MTASLGLCYPNGRLYRCEYEFGRRIGLGDEFGLYGHRWRVDKLLHERPPDHRRFDPISPRLVCVTVGDRPPS